MRGEWIFCSFPQASCFMVRHSSGRCGFYFFFFFFFLISYQPWHILITNLTRFSIWVAVICDLCGSFIGGSEQQQQHNFPMSPDFVHTCFPQLVMCHERFTTCFDSIWLIFIPFLHLVCTVSSLHWCVGHLFFFFFYHNLSLIFLFPVSQVRVRWAGEKCVSGLRQWQWCSWGAQARLRGRADRWRPSQEVSDPCDFCLLWRCMAIGWGVKLHGTT